MPSKRASRSAALQKPSMLTCGDGKGDGLNCVNCFSALKNGMQVCRNDLDGCPSRHVGQIRMLYQDGARGRVGKGGWGRRRDFLEMATPALATGGRAQALGGAAEQVVIERSNSD